MRSEAPQSVGQTKLKHSIRGHRWAQTGLRANPRSSPAVPGTLWSWPPPSRLQGVLDAPNDFCLGGGRVSAAPAAAPQPNPERGSVRGVRPAGSCASRTAAAGSVRSSAAAWYRARTLPPRYRLPMPVGTMRTDTERRERQPSGRVGTNPS